MQYWSEEPQKEEGTKRERYPEEVYSAARPPEVDCAENSPHYGATAEEYDSESNVLIA